MPTIQDALVRGEAVLSYGGVADPRRESVSLLAFALRKDKTYLYAHPEHVLTTSETESFESVIERRAFREPLQYITGVQEFYGLEFEVTPDVLIPRPETEIVVEKAIEILGNNGTFCEVGVGSGCISVAILSGSTNVNAVALEISPEAIDVAKRNALRNGVDDRIRFLRSDVFDSLADERFDLIVSNPPYVPARDLHGLQREVRDFEPRVALTDGSDGVSIIRRIVEGSPEFLRPRGHLLMEIGFDQSNRVAEMFSHDIWEAPHLLPDLQGIPRVVLARLK